jgi:aspartate kinase
MATKVKAGGIIRNERLARIGVMSAPDRCGLACDVLHGLAQKNINVEFIVQCIDLEGNSHIVLCVREENLDAALGLLKPMQTSLQARDITYQRNMVVISVFGPDFRERPSIAAAVFESMASAGINIMAISTSISTVSCLIDGARVEDAIVSLREHFDLP